MFYEFSLYLIKGSVRAGTLFCSLLCVQCLSLWFKKKSVACIYIIHQNINCACLLLIRPQGTFFSSVFFINEYICLTNINSKLIKNIINTLPVLLNSRVGWLCVCGSCDGAIPSNSPLRREIGLLSAAGGEHRVNARSLFKLRVLKIGALPEMNQQGGERRVTSLSKITERLQRDGCRAGYSKCGPRTNSVSIDRGLLETQILRPTNSEPLRVGPRAWFTSPPRESYMC